MGCDIHLIVEVRKNGKWEEAQCLRKCGWCDGAGKSKHREGEDCYGCKGTGQEDGFGSRNYDTFAVLANVRNGFGFAGCATGEAIVPISEPRGLPKDMSRAAEMAASEEDIDTYGWLGDHSHSYLTLAELLAYNWDAGKKKYGTLSMEEFAKWEAKGGGWPDSWCGGVSGPNVFYVSNETMRGLIRDKYQEDVQKHIQFAKDCKWGKMDTEQSYASFYTQVEWGDTIATCCREFHDDFIPGLCKLGAPEDVRIVFGFDS